MIPLGLKETKELDWSTALKVRLAGEPFPALRAGDALRWGVERPWRLLGAAVSLNG